jgi:predicted lipoprotein with Yx(FWY)xxD motif
MLVRQLRALACVLVLTVVAVEMAVETAVVAAMAVEMVVVVEMAVALEQTSLTGLIFENDVANALSCLVEQILNLLSLCIVEVGAV